MGDHPVPSISWRTYRRKPSAVHFGWEFGTGDTACSKHIPVGAQVNSTEDREITCRECLYQVYDIPLKRRQKNTFLIKNIKNSHELIRLIWLEIGKFEASLGEYGAKKRVAESMGLLPRSLDDILKGRANVSKRVAQYFGYTKTTGFIKDESDR